MKKTHINEKTNPSKDGGRGCSSYIGYLNDGEQEMNLAPECFGEVGTVIHEFLHCLGFVHEHCSPERDGFINIVWANVESGHV